jgi:hypothetical protein
MKRPTGRHLGLIHRAATLACRQVEHGQHLTWEDTHSWPILLAHATTRPGVTHSEDQIVFPNGSSITRVPSTAGT